MYRKVDVGTWGDAKFRSLSAPPPNAQFLWFFLMTGKYTCNIPGIVLAGPMEMAAFLRWPEKGFRKAFAEVTGKGMAEVDEEAGLVWLPKGPWRNKPESPNVVKGWAKTWPSVPECPLKLKAWQGLKVYTDTLSVAFREAFAKALAQPTANQKQEQKQEQEQEVKPLRTSGARGWMPSPSELQTIYESYPHKKGKREGLQYLLKLFRDEPPDSRRTLYALILQASMTWGSAWAHVPIKYRGKCRYFSTWCRKHSWDDEGPPVVISTAPDYAQPALRSDRGLSVDDLARMADEDDSHE